jgi:hypothetical protein
MTLFVIYYLLKFDDEDQVFDEVTEERYAEIVEKRRESDFVVDDGL